MKKRILSTSGIFLLIVLLAVVFAALSSSSTSLRHLTACFDPENIWGCGGGGDSSVSSALSSISSSVTVSSVSSSSLSTSSSVSTSSISSSSLCGDGVTDAGEECDDGVNNIPLSLANTPQNDIHLLSSSDFNRVQNSTCLDTCTRPACSDAVDGNGNLAIDADDDGCYDNAVARRGDKIEVELDGNVLDGGEHTNLAVYMKGRNIEFSEACELGGVEPTDVETAARQNFAFFDSVVAAGGESTIASGMSAETCKEQTMKKICNNMTTPDELNACCTKYARNRAAEICKVSGGTCPAPKRALLQQELVTYCTCMKVPPVKTQDATRKILGACEQSFCPIQCKLGKETPACLTCLSENNRLGKCSNNIISNNCEFTANACDDWPGYPVPQQLQPNATMKCSVVDTAIATLRQSCYDHCEVVPGTKKPCEFKLTGYSWRCKKAPGSQADLRPEGFYFCPKSKYDPTEPIPPGCKAPKSPCEMYPPPGNVACKQTPPEPLNACGNNKTEGDEFCDDGVLLNNTYGHCKSDCTGMGPFCGDGSTNGDGAKNKEDCDDGLENGKCGKCKTDCTAGSACPKSPQAVRVGALLDTNADGSLTPREMFRGVLSMVRAIITQNLAFDLNDDGAVNRSDLKDLVTELRAEIAGNV